MNQSDLGPLGLDYKYRGPMGLDYINNFISIPQLEKCHEETVNLMKINQKAS